MVTELIWWLLVQKHISDVSALDISKFIMSLFYTVGIALAAELMNTNILLLHLATKYPYAEFVQYNLIKQITDKVFVRLKTAA